MVQGSVVECNAVWNLWHLGSAAWPTSLISPNLVNLRRVHNIGHTTRAWDIKDAGEVGDVTGALDLADIVDIREIPRNPGHTPDT